MSRRIFKRAEYLKYIAVAVLFAVLIALMADARMHPLPPAARKPVPSSRSDYEPLRQAIQDYTATQEGTFAVYFEDLTSGQVMGIDEDAPHPGASCIKVPVVLDLYQQVAAGKMHWTDRVAYQAAQDYESGAGAMQYTAEDGNTFSLRCLATVAITISDNVAHNMLVRYLGYDNVMNFIKRIGGAETVEPYGSETTTARDLGSFMEAVYRFARQNPAQGGRLIDDLANTIFHVGLPGKIPPDLIVAHKEGSISGVVNDMGIVFAKHPFILTVMSEGTTDEDTGFSNIAEISRLVYDFQQQLPAKLQLRPRTGFPNR